MKSIVKEAIRVFEKIDNFNDDEKIEIINELKKQLHEKSPFINEPVDCVLWVKSENVIANDYNPNRVAPPEMKLLEHSISEDGYTQPIVAWQKDDSHVVIDGFHRNRVGKECETIKKRIMGYLPITVIKKDREDRSDRISSTIRHNRARGRHTVEGMSEIVLELKNRNWTNKRIAKELGMEQDEILRLCQITGLAGLFSDDEFSESWDAEESASDFVDLDDDITLYNDEEALSFRTVNTSDKDRIFHKWDKWECYRAGFYNKSMPNMSRDECEKEYYNFLSDIEKFDRVLDNVISEWKHSCEHYLSNKAMNRIAWLGQAAICYDTGVPSVFSSGFNLLTKIQQEKANETALSGLNVWLSRTGRDMVSMEEALGKGREMNLY